MKYRAVGTIILTAALVAGCSSPAPSNAPRAPVKASEAEMSAANQRRLSCLYQHVTRLDDGVSDVSTIVDTVVSLCSNERRHFFNVTSRGMGNLRYQTVQAELLRMDRDAAAYYVLSNRADKRQTQP